MPAWSEGFRSRLRMRYPWPRRYGITWRPALPVPPVNTIRLGMPDLSLPVNGARRLYHGPRPCSWEPPAAERLLRPRPAARLLARIAQAPVRLVGLDVELGD